MLTSNVPRRELRDDHTQGQIVACSREKVLRAARLLVTGAEHAGNRWFRELRAGDLLFLRLAVEEADALTRKESVR